MKAIGADAFGPLKAEGEGEWLLEAFVPPPDFHHLCEPRSFIIFGREGSGKSALYRALYSHASPHHLVVEWEPFFPSKDPSTREGLFEMLEALFRSIALAILKRITRGPALEGLPDWAKGFIVSFIRYAFGETCGKELALRGFSELISYVLPADPLPSSLTSTPPVCMAELLKALSPLGLRGIWIMGDNIDRWLIADKGATIACLRAFFSALPLFEIPGLCFKLFLPAVPDLSGLTRASSVERMRVEIYRINWTREALKQIVEKRFYVASGGEVGALSQVIEPEALPELLSWLERWGGESPRGWLEAARPLASLFFNSPEGGPVRGEKWREARRRVFPRLLLDPEEKKVTVGWREIEDIPESLFSVLSYLYERAGKLCSREELYFKAYRKLPSIPSPGEKGWEESWTWNDVLDNLLHRLRQLIEPDPSDPILITTVRGKGVKLESWL